MNQYNKFLDKFIIIKYFIRTRWLLKFTKHSQLDCWQKKQLANFFKKTLLSAPFFLNYKNFSLSTLPMMDKQIMMSNFDALNTKNIKLEEAISVAKQAEASRDFSPTINDITVGMSSGTSGKQGIFLVSKQERLRWAGILLAKALPTHLLRQILKPWQEPVRIAFFLRANSNLYNTLNSKRIDFAFYDLLEGMGKEIPKLNQNLPDILVAPATVLATLAKAKLKKILHISPSHIISVAEVLEETDSTLIKQAFGITPHQIYQATEGFLAYTCKEGSLHLNEAHLHIEKEWLDQKQIRFVPIVTDFSRTTQLIVRYRLNDIIKISPKPCSCGRVETTIEAIEGRSDEIFWLNSLIDTELIAIYPDLIRRSMMLVEPTLSEYTITQEDSGWQINFIVSQEEDREKAVNNIIQQINILCTNLNVQTPKLQFDLWHPLPVGAKRRRLICKRLKGNI